MEGIKDGRLTNLDHWRRSLSSCERRIETIGRTMLKLFTGAILFMSLALVVESAKRMAPAACEVGELVQHVNPVCGTKNGDECETYCKTTHGVENVKSWRCLFDDGRSEGECICGLRCALAFVAGDPHIRTWDGIFTSFQTTCPHVLAKFDTSGSMGPDFEMNLENIQRYPNKRQSYPHRLNLTIVGWALHVSLDLDAVTLTINGEELRMAVFEYRRVLGRTVNFLRIHREDRSAWRIRTSFGLRVDVHMPRDGWRDLFFYLPRTPMYSGNVRGALGNMDGNRLNDFIGGNAIQYYPTKLEDPERFAASWCPEHPEAQRDASERASDEDAHEQYMAQCSNVNRTIEETCGSTLGHGLQCLTSEERNTALGDCKIDVCYAYVLPPANTKSAMQNAANGIREAFGMVCAYEESGFVRDEYM